MRIFFGILIVILGLLAGYSVSKYKAPEIQADIDGRIEGAFTSTETMADLSVDTDGRHVTLKGYAANEAEKEQILARADDVWGALGPVDEIKLLEVAAPYQVSVTKHGDGRITLSGVAPSKADRAALVRHAEEVFDADVANDLRLAAGKPEGDWLGTVENGMHGLAVLNHGRLDVVDQVISLSGDAAKDADAAKIAALQATRPDGFSWSDSWQVLQPTVSPYSFAVRGEGDVLKVTGHAPDEATRAALLAKIEANAGGKTIEADIQLAEGMPSDDWPDRVNSAIDAYGRLENGGLVVADDDVRLEGDVANMTELGDIQKIAAATPGGDAWQSDLVVLRPTVRPYVVSIDKGEDGTWTLAGVAPDEASRDALIAATKLAAKGASVDARLQLADGRPGEDWQAFVEDRLEALDSIKSGKLSFTDYDAKLEGIVATLDDAAAADEQVTLIDPDIDTELEALDPTVAAFIDLRLSPDDGITLDGALPPDLSRDEAIKTLGIQGEFQGELEENGRGDAQAWRQDLAVIGSYLPEFETVELNLKAGRAAVTGKTYEKSDSQQVIDKLAAALDDHWLPDLSIQPTDRRYADGTRRINPLNGIDEEFRRGFWLPVTTIEAGLDTCRDRTSLILATNKITFLVGEARLDARARRIINDLSAVAIGCLEENQLRLEIGGHTDSRGADEMNLKLSEARANAVMASLAERGVSAKAMTATGYGETDPIADNALDEGRSANRRITFKWLDGAQGNG